MEDEVIFRDLPDFGVRVKIPEWCKKYFSANSIHKDGDVFFFYAKDYAEAKDRIFFASTELFSHWVVYESRQEQQRLKKLLPKSYIPPF